MKAVPIQSEMFKRVDGAIIQCIVRPKYTDAFIKLGFVESIDKLPKTRQKKVSKDGNSDQRGSNQGSLSINPH
jgi:hypothetical protein